MSDYEKNAESSEEKGHGGPQATSEEYANLIEFIRAQKNTSADEEGADQTHVVKKRSMLTPWKTYEVRVNKDGEAEEVAAKVPSSW
jgi:H+-transporting ATPase